MSKTIQFKRGLKTNLPNLAVGEPGFCTDTHELFIGSATGNVQFADPSQIASLQGIDSYSTTVTKDANGNVTKVEVKDGSTVIHTTNITYDANNLITSIVDILNGKTVTTTPNYDADGNIISVTKEVV